MYLLHNAGELCCNDSSFFFLTLLMSGRNDDNRTQMSILVPLCMNLLMYVYVRVPTP